MRLKRFYKTHKEHLQDSILSGEFTPSAISSEDLVDLKCWAQDVLKLEKITMKKVKK